MRQTMSFNFLSISALLTGLTVLFSTVIMRSIRLFGPPKDSNKENGGQDASAIKSTATMSHLEKALAENFPTETLLPHQIEGLDQYRNTYWGQQASDVRPTVVVKPKDTQQLCKLLEVFRDEYNRRLAAAASEANGDKTASPETPLFAIRSGGHCLYSSTMSDGAVIDMRSFDAMVLSEDTKSVTLGTAVTWGKATKYLQDRGLAIAGGRDSNVGVGGLTLAGGVSYFSPRIGWVCSTVISFRVVLASGQVVTASATEHPDLFQAMKVGSNNFGIVTSITFPTFKARKVWSGFVYMPHFEAKNCVLALHEWLNRGSDPSSSVPFDQDAAGPITAISYVDAIKSSMVTNILMHTNPKPGDSSWPACFKKSRYRQMWRFWNTCKVQPLTAALNEISASNPHGLRRVFCTTVVKNDLEILRAAHSSHDQAIGVIRQHSVKGLIWNFLIQPLPPAKVSDDEETASGPGPMGLENSSKEPLVLILFCHGWEKSEDDDLIRTQTRQAIKRIDHVAEANNTSHPFRYLNYCDDWQKPFESYGAENLAFLQEMSRKYDEHGLFQKACTGAYKVFDQEA